MIDETGVTLRPATPDDAERIARLLSDEGFPAGAADIVTRLEQFSGPSSSVVVADLDDEVLGFVAVHVLPRFEQDEGFVRIVALVVDPGARERGVGRLLMQEAERIGSAAGCAFAEVTAGHRRADALRMYESLGYDATITSYLRKRL